MSDTKYRWILKPHQTVLFAVSLLFITMKAAHAETIVTLLPYEKDNVPRQHYLRRESPVMRVRFESKNEHTSEVKGQLSLMLGTGVLQAHSYTVKLPAAGTTYYELRLPLQQYRVAAYRVITAGTLTGTPAKTFTAEAPLWICPEPERGGMTFAMLDDKVRRGEELDKYLESLRAMGMTGVMHYNATVPLRERALWYGLNVMSVSHSDARRAGYTAPIESRYRRNASGQPFLNYGSTDQRTRWGIADTDWQDATARNLEQNIASLMPYPSYDPRISTSDDHFMWTGLDYNPWNVRRFKEIHGIEPPRPPEALATDFPLTVARPKGVIPDNEPWVLWMRFLSRDVLGRYNQQLTQAVLRATNGLGKIGPVSGGGPNGHRGPMGLIPLVDLESGQWPAYNFGANGFNLGFYYNYNSYFYPALAQVYWAELARMGNRAPEKRLEQWLMPDVWDPNPSYHLHNWNLYMASDLQGLVYFIHGQMSPGAEQALSQVGPVTRRYRQLLGELKPVPRKVGFLMPFENACFRTRYPADASYAFGNLLMAHAEAEPVMPEELNERAGQYKVVLLHDIDWLTESNLKILQDYIAGGGRVLVDTLCEVEVPGAQRLDFGLGEAGRNTGYGNLETVEKVKAALERTVQPWARSDNPYLLLRHFRRDGVDYLWAVNLMSREQDAARIPPVPPAQPGPVPEPVRLEEVDYRGDITVPLPNAFVYDVLNGRELPVRRGNGVLRLPVATKTWQGALLAFYPGAPQTLRVSAPRRIAAGKMLQMKVEILSGRRRMEAVLPLEITIVEPGGTLSTEYSRSALTDKGSCTLRVPLAINEHRGLWQIRVRELSAGLEKNITVNVSS